MNVISVFDMFKVGIGPSSSHTLGPWKAAQHFITHLSKETKLRDVKSLDVSLYGSLALTGKGHATDIALCMGLESKDYKQISTASILSSFESIKTKKRLKLTSEFEIAFNIDENIHFDFISIPKHANTLKFEATLNSKDSNPIVKSLCVARACRHHLSSVHPSRVGVQSEPGCSSPFYLPTFDKPPRVRQTTDACVEPRLARPQGQSHVLAYRRSRDLAEPGAR